MGTKDGGQGYALGQTPPGVGTWSKPGPSLAQVRGQGQAPAAVFPGSVSTAQSWATFRKIWGDKAGGSEPGPLRREPGTREPPTLGPPSITNSPPPSQHHLLQAALPQQHLLQAGVRDAVAR